MGALTTGLLAATLVGSTISQAQQAKSAAKQQQRAMQQAERNAQQDATMRDIAVNAANRKRPKAMESLLTSAIASYQGNSGMSAGAQGITDPLPLGRATLLGS